MSEQVIDQATGTMTQLRCPCGQLLARIRLRPGAAVEIKCRRCHQMNAVAIPEPKSC